MEELETHEAEADHQQEDVEHLGDHRQPQDPCATEAEAVTWDTQGGHSRAHPTPHASVGGSSHLRIDLCCKADPEKGKAIMATHPPHKAGSGIQAQVWGTLGVPVACPGWHVTSKQVHSVGREELLSCGYARAPPSLLICSMTATGSHLWPGGHLP